MSAKPSAVYANRMQRYPDDVWLIWSNKWGCWYRPDSAGYTADVLQAGLYGRDEAASHWQEAPRKYRDTEPFPMSVVRHHVRRALDDQRSALAANEARFAGFIA